MRYYDGCVMKKIGLVSEKKQTLVIAENILIQNDLTHIYLMIFLLKMIKQFIFISNVTKVQFLGSISLELP